ncbi:MAG: hypothetical protein QXV17_05975 [Candidatus Micrarchaeaceae archaeon]
MQNPRKRYEKDSTTPTKIIPECGREKGDNMNIAAGKQIKRNALCAVLSL